MITGIHKISSPLRQWLIGFAYRMDVNDSTMQKSPQD